MCFSPEQMEKLDEGAALVLVVYSDGKDLDNYQLVDAFITPSGVFDNEVCGTFWAETVAALRVALMVREEETEKARDGIDAEIVTAVTDFIEGVEEGEGA